LILTFRHTTQTKKQETTLKSKQQKQSGYRQRLFTRYGPSNKKSPDIFRHV